MSDDVPNQEIIAKKNREAERLADSLPPDQADLARALKGDCPVKSPAHPND